VTPLDALKAALEAKQEAEAAMVGSLTDGVVAGVEYRRWRKREAYEDATWAIHALLTDDTIAALIAVAEAARVADGLLELVHRVLGWWHPIKAARRILRNHIRWQVAAQRLIFRTALAPLVKEETDDRA
jgi:acylphosphatase